MSDSAYGKALRDAKLAEALLPPKTVRQLSAMSRTIDETGAITAQAVAPYRTPLVMSWGPSDTTWQRVARAGRVVLMASYVATTAPTSVATVQLYQAVESDPSSTSIVASLAIPTGGRFADDAPMINVPAGAWLRPSLVAGSGAAGVNVTITITQG